MREEFNRAEKLANDKRAGKVGFALTILQRRLASSPEAIYQSLRRRSERLQKRLRELELLQRGATAEAIAAATPALDSDDLEDLDEAPDNEVEEVEEPPGINRVLVRRTRYFYVNEGQGNSVIINLSEQRAYLIEKGKVTLIWPIAGNFTIFSKDIDHHSRGFGSVVDASGRIINSNATAGMHGGYLPGYPASHGCVRMPKDLAAKFIERVHIGTPLMVIGSTHNLARVRKAIPIFTNGKLVLRQR